MLRFVYIYSCFMVAAGSSLLAELPGTVTLEAVQPAVHEIEPTPATGPYQEIQPTLAVAAAPSPPPTMKMLREKQRQLEQLQQEVGELSKSLGVAPQYQVQCVMGEVDMKKLRQLAPEIHWDQQQLSIVDLLERPASDAGQALPAPQFHAVEKCLQTTGTMRTLMSPTLVVQAWQPTAMMSGGQFAVPTTAEASAPVTWRSFGVSLITEVQPIGRGKVKVRVVPEYSERNLKHSVKVHGIVVPGVDSRSISTTMEMKLGETQIYSMLTSREKTPTCLLIAVTVTDVEPLAAATETVSLQPIPDRLPGQ